MTSLFGLAEPVRCLTDDLEETLSSPLQDGVRIECRSPAINSVAASRMSAIRSSSSRLTGGARRRRSSSQRDGLGEDVLVASCETTDGDDVDRTPE